MENKSYKRKRTQSSYNNYKGNNRNKRRASKSKSKGKSKSRVRFKRILIILILLISAIVSVKLFTYCLDLNTSMKSSQIYKIAGNQ